MGPVCFHIIQNMAEVGDDHTGFGPQAGAQVLLREGVDSLTDELDILQIHAGIRLIQHDKIRLLCQELNHLGALYLATGEASIDISLAEGLKVHLAEDSCCVSLGIDDLDEVFEPQAANGWWALKGHANAQACPFVHRHVRDIFSFE